MNAQPKRSLSQNFLVDRQLSVRIVEEVGVGPGDVVLEIGPGRGALTFGLHRVVQACGSRLVVVELDDRLAAELAQRFQDHKCIEVIHGDILDLSLNEIHAASERLRVVGNIPYHLTTPIIFHLLSHPRPREVLLMVQREVADRILAPPGGRAYGALTVGVRATSTVRRVLQVPARAFRPRPLVDSTVIRITPLDPAPLTPSEEGRLRDLTRALFQWRRKQLGKILRDHPALRLSPEQVERVVAAAGARRTDRPEVLEPEGFVAMSRSIGEPRSDVIDSG